MTILSPIERQRLRAQGHHINPVVRIGHQGLTPSVHAEIERALLAHGLIKVHIFSDDRDQRLLMCTTICHEQQCQVVQTIGKRLLLWRPLPSQQKQQNQQPKTASQLKKPRPPQTKYRKVPLR